MALLNYTTIVAADKTAAEIQQILVKHGARTILLNFGDAHELTGLSFQMETQNGILPFTLPANVKAVERLLLKLRRTQPETWQHDYEPVMERIRQQAQRVAWRILKTWVQAQVAIIETGMVSVEEAFLPYLMIGKTSMFEMLKGRGFLLPEGRGE